MTQSRSQLSLDPEKCDQCGRCVAVCEKRALRVTGDYIHVDSKLCDSCLACVDVCGRGAIVRAAAKRSGSAPAGARPVVGSRAEAKAIRQAAVESQKRAEAQKKGVHLDRADIAEGRVVWTLFDAAAVLAVLLASFVASDVVMSSPAIKLVPASAQAGIRSSVLAVFYAVQMGLLAFLAHRHGTTFLSAFGLRRMGRGAGRVASTAGVVLLLAVLTRAASAAWGFAANAWGWAPPNNASLTTVFGSGGIGLSLAIITVVVIGPLAEELAFRGVILRAAGARWGMWPAILGTAALFSAYHFTAWTFVPLFVLGTALGWVAWKRRSLWAAISLHVLYNGIAVAAAYWSVSR